MLESENWSCKLLIILTVNVQVWPYQFFFLMVNKTYEKDRSKYLNCLQIRRIAFVTQTILVSRIYLLLSLS